MEGEPSRRLARGKVGAVELPSPLPSCAGTRLGSAPPSLRRGGTRQPVTPHAGARAHTRGAGGHLPPPDGTGTGPRAHVGMLVHGLVHVFLWCMAGPQYTVLWCMAEPVHAQNWCMVKLLHGKLGAWPSQYTDHMINFAFCLFWFLTLLSIVVIYVQFERTKTKPFTKEGSP